MKFINLVLFFLLLFLSSCADSSQNYTQAIFQTEFSESDLAESNLNITSAGFSSIPLAEVSLGQFNPESINEPFSDGRGLTITAKHGEGVMLIAPEISVDQPILIECSVRVQSSEIAFTLGGFDQNGAYVSTSQINQFQVNQWMKVHHTIYPFSETIQPFFQIMNNSRQQKLLTLNIDRLKVITQHDIGYDASPPGNVFNASLNKPYPLNGPYVSLFVLDCFILLFAAMVFESVFSAQRLSERLVLLWLYGSSMVVLTAYCLSLLHSLNSVSGWLGIHILFLVIALILRYRYGGNSLFYSYKLSPPIEKFPIWFTVLGAIVGVGILFVWTLNLFYPTHFIEFDGMSYHLPRVHFYLQQGSLDAFQTLDPRKTDFPFLAEIQYSWIVLFTRSVRMLLVLQWGWVIIAALALFTICRRLQVEKIYALTVAVLWIGTPDVLWHVSWIKNDLLTANYAIIALMLLFGLRETFWVPALGISLSLSLALGTKYSALFVSISIVIAAVFILVQQESSFRKIICIILMLGTMFLLLGSYHYWDVFLRDTTIQESYPNSYNQLQIEIITVNFVRLMGELTDSIAWFRVWLTSLFNQPIPDVREPLVALLSNISYLDPYSGKGFWALHGTGITYQLGTNFLGISLGVVASVIIGLFASFNKKKDFLILLWPLWMIAFLSLIPMLIISWQPRPMIRIFLPVLILFYPFMGFAFQTFWEKNIVIRWGVIIITAFSIATTILYYSTFLYNYFHQNPFRFLYNVNSSVQMNTEFEKHLQIQLEMQEFLKQHFSPQDAIAVRESFSLDFVHIGEHFQRPVYLILDHLSTPDIQKIFENKPEINVIFFPTNDLKAYEKLNVYPIIHEMVAVTRVKI